MNSHLFKLRDFEQTAINSHLLKQHDLGQTTINPHLFTLHDFISEDLQQRNGVAVCTTEHLSNDGQQVPHALWLTPT